MFFYEPIFWLAGQFVNLSPVNVFAFLSSLKVDKYKMPMCKYANLQVCKCASIQMCKYVNVQICN